MERERNDQSAGDGAAMPVARLGAGGGSLRGRWEYGKVKLGCLLWLLGVPIPIVLLVVLLRSCGS